MIFSQTILYILLLGVCVASVAARPTEEHYGRIQRNYDRDNLDDSSDDMMYSCPVGGGGGGEKGEADEEERGERVQRMDDVDGVGAGAEPGGQREKSPMRRGKGLLIPHKALNIALKAAKEAKFASDSQMSAAAGAAQEVKTQLAEKAMTAARAAEAALMSKQQIVSQLEQEVREAETIVQEQSASLRASQYNTAAASEASQQAKLEYKTLNAAMQMAKNNVDNAEIAANGAAQELSEKKSLIEAAKNRVAILLRQLNTARSDFTNTRKAAYRAACAAQAARQKAES